MADRSDRAGHLRQRRIMQASAAGVAGVCALIAVGAVFADKSVTPYEVQPPVVPEVEAASAGAVDVWRVSPDAMEVSLARVHEMEPEPTQSEQGGDEGDQAPPPPQDVKLVATIGAGENLSAVIREGATQLVLRKGERAGGWQALDVQSRSARIRKGRVTKDLTLDPPMLLVSDIGFGGGGDVGTQGVAQPGQRARTTVSGVGEDRTVSPTTTRFSRRQPGTASSGGRQGQGGQGQGGRDRRQQEQEQGQPRARTGGGNGGGNGGNVGGGGNN
ncbi:MAG: hypothetical protein AAFX79_01880 [Planctomycetota bacterium]